MKLHLGCGNNYLDGYTNVELPCNRHFTADVYSDINDLIFPDSSVEEIVIEHVFEHFDRPTALSLIIKWNRWMVEGGKLIIVVPDFMRNARSILDENLSFGHQQALLRHIFGSQEADWAIHRDGWFTEKFFEILRRFGFDLGRVISITIDSTPVRYDIKVEAIKTVSLSVDAMIAQSTVVLSDSLFGNEPDLLEGWMQKIYFLIDRPVPVKDMIEELKRDLVLIFSKDRAMQLDCTLRTFYKYCEDYAKLDIKVLYRCTSPAHKNQYSRLQGWFPHVQFLEETDFRNNVIYLLSGYPHVLMCVDDTIFTHKFKARDAIDLLKKEPSIIGVSLRLGLNTTYSYNSNTEQDLPDEFNVLDNNIVIFKWENQSEDFSYPMELSSSIYRTDDIYNIAMRVHWSNPNSLEHCLNTFKHILNERILLACYKTSIAFSNPVNMVQTYCDNRHGEIASSDLLDKFHKGYRIDIDPFHEFLHDSCHYEVDFKFVHGNFNQNNPVMSIIIPAYNGLNHLKECLYSIARNTNNSYEIFVIDNRGDNINDFLQLEFPEVKIIVNDYNRGVSVARNQAMSMSIGEFIVCIDDDVVVTRSWDSKFLRYFNALPTVGIMGPRSNWASGPQLVTDGEYSDIVELEQFAAGFDRSSGRLTKSIRLVGFCLFMRRQVVDKIGGFDERFMCGFDDDDFSLRAYLAGFFPMIANDIFIHHVGGPTKNGNLQYLEVLSTAFDIFKNKWGIDPNLKLGDSYTLAQIEYSKFDIVKHCIPLTDWKKERVINE
jgi:GT2 family glycosyltransferase/predicted SAM-dependent methyltransferase